MSSNRPHDTLPSGYKLLWYELGRILGQGGFGITYLAQDTQLNQPVAIKEYLPADTACRHQDGSVHPTSEAQAGHFQEGLERFMAEARILAQFQHPNILQVRSVVEQNNTAYMLMDYEQGEDLQLKFNRGELTTEACLLKILLPVLDGLALIHKKGFIHRDIKPANIFIRHDGSPVLLDFGSACSASLEEAPNIDRLLTGGYAPLEQYSEDMDGQGPWTDLYALGASLYKAITGELPASTLLRAKALKNAEPDPYMPAEQLGAGAYSTHFLEAVDWALRINHRDRPQSAEALALALTGSAAVPPLENGFAVIAPEEEKIATALNLRPNHRRTQARVDEPETTMRWDGIVNLPIDDAPEFLAVSADEAEQIEALPRVTLHGKAQAPDTEFPQGMNKFQGAHLANPAPSTPRPKMVWWPSLAAGATVGVVVAVLVLVTNFKLETTPSRAPTTQTQQRPEVDSGIAKIPELLELAAQDYQASRIAQPPGRNALERYRQVLSLEPGNSKAKIGLRRLANHYASRAEQAIVDGKQAEAKKYLAKAESIDSKAVAVALLQASIAESKVNERTTADLLARAAQQVAANRLSTPAGNNAVETYQAILQSQPGHNGALNGLEKIKQQYELWLKAAIQKGNWKDATIYVRKALKLDPDDPALAETLRKIAAAKRTEREAALQVGRESTGKASQYGTGRSSVIARNAQQPTPETVPTPEKLF